MSSDNPTPTPTPETLALPTWEAMALWKLRFAVACETGGLEALVEFVRDDLPGTTVTEDDLRYLRRELQRTLDNLTRKLNACCPPKEEVKP